MQLLDVENLIEQTHRQLALSYPFLCQWRVELDHARRRGGCCRPGERRITLSRHHIAHNSIEVVTDTLLHEFAHAIAFHCFGERGHGKVWKRVARELGATPKATGRFNLPLPPWILVHYCPETRRVSKIAERFRRNSRIRHYFVKNQPNTRGQLFYLCQQQMKDYFEGKITLDELNFHQ